MQILLLGMHRSGTSLATRLLNLMGAYFGPEGSIGELTADNPKGFWERPEVFKLNEAILAHAGCSWSDLRGWEPSKAAHIPDKLQYNIRKFLTGMDAFRPWVLKDPRLCLLLPAWMPMLEVPIAVLMYRHPMEVALSLYKRDKFAIEYSLALWEYYVVHLLNATLRMPRLYLHHRDLIERPVEASELLLTQLREEGVRRLDMPSAREIHAFIDTRLYRSRSEPNKQPPLPPSLLKLCELMQGNETQTTLLKVSDASKSLLQHGPALAA